MSVLLSPLAGAAWQFFDNNGAPLAGGLLYTYVAGTTTPLASYTSLSGTTAHSNPIVLDAAGRVPYEVWLDSLSVYKFILETSASVQIGSWDNISPSSGGGGGGGATGGGNDKVFYLNDQIVTTNYAIPTDNNAGTFGPLTIAANITVTIPANSTWSII